MTTNEICSQIMEICTDDEKVYKEYKPDLSNLIFGLKDSLPLDHEIASLIETHRELCKIKNNKARSVETNIVSDLLFALPLELVRKLGKDNSLKSHKRITLQDTYDEEADSMLKINSAILNYAKELLESEEEKGKRYKNRMRDILKLLEQLNVLYDITDVKQLFLNKIEDTDTNVQSAALIGLENYYGFQASEEPTKDEIEKLKQVIKTTASRTNAVSCCQILIMAGEMDELNAMMMMGNF